MRKVDKKCENCKFCKMTDGNRICTSTWSSMYMENLYPDETCEVFAQKHKSKKVREFTQIDMSLFDKIHEERK